MRVTKWRERQKTNLEQSDDYGSIEITELLLRSRQQPNHEKGAAHFAWREGSEDHFEVPPPHNVSENENGTFTDVETSRGPSVMSTIRKAVD